MPRKTRRPEPPPSSPPEGREASRRKRKTYNFRMLDPLHAHLKHAKLKTGRDLDKILAAAFYDYCARHGLGWPEGLDQFGNETKAG